MIITVDGYLGVFIQSPRGDQAGSAHTAKGAGNRQNMYHWHIFSALQDYLVNLVETSQLPELESYSQRHNDAHLFE